MHMLIAIAGGAHCLELAGEPEGGEGERERGGSPFFLFNPLDGTLKTMVKKIVQA